jgi:hypothetical protein
LFAGWARVDDAHGYAYVSITNSSTSAATAKCLISAKDDFGDFGFDSLMGEAVGAGQTVQVKIPISVSKGSFLINSREVTGC